MKILDSYLSKSDFFIRANKLKISNKNLMMQLNQLDYKCKQCNEYSDAIIVENPENITTTELFKSGFFIIQDLGSIIISELLKPTKNSNVLDICAAPGSKTTHLAQIMNNTGNIIANDINKKRSSNIEENIIKLGCTNIKCTTNDAIRYIKEWDNKFDYILADLPCSGTGIVIKKPEIKLNTTIENIKELVNIQKQIIENTIKYLKTDGVLLFSTCSILKEENEYFIEWILNNFKNIKLVEINLFKQPSKFLKFLPFTYNNGGFFAVKFKKI